MQPSKWTKRGDNRSAYATYLDFINKIERRKRRRRQNKNRPINLPQGNNITLTFIIHNHYNIYISTQYIHTYMIVINFINNNAFK